MNNEFVITCIPFLGKIYTPPQLPPSIKLKGAPDPVAREVYRGLLCLRKILQKPTDSVPQQDCEYQKLKSGCET